MGKEKEEKEGKKEGKEKRIGDSPHIGLSYERNKNNSKDSDSISRLSKLGVAIGIGAGISAAIFGLYHVSTLKERNREYNQWKERVNNSETIEYIVKTGDRPYNMAQEEGADLRSEINYYVEKLLEENGYDSAEELKAGESIKIPDVNGDGKVYKN